MDLLSSMGEKVRQAAEQAVAAPVEESPSSAPPSQGGGLSSKSPEELRALVTKLVKLNKGEK